MALSAKLRELIDRKKGNLPSPRNAEIDRIVALPIEGEITEGEIEAASQMFLRPAAYAAGERLLPGQAAALLTYDMHDTMFGQIVVGGGKALTSLWIADRAIRRGATKVILLLPASVYPQFMERDLRWIRSMIPIGCAVHGMGNKSLKSRMRLAASGFPGCYVVPYSVLSTRTGSELLEAINPDDIVADEGHKLSNRNSARTKRLFRWMHTRKPEPPGLTIMSGTITRKKVADYQHLIRASLGMGSPLPMSVQMTSDWGLALDSTVTEVSAGVALGPISPLLTWAKNVDPAGEYPADLRGFRAAYKLRFKTCPGVVTSTRASVGTSLEYRFFPDGVKPPEPNAKLKDLIDQVNEQWLTPNGDEIEHAIHTYKWNFELTSGFYNQLKWPTADELSRKKTISLAEAQHNLVGARAHHELAQCYKRLLRRFFMDHWIQGCDTPMLVGNEFKMHQDKNLPTDLYRAWVAMHDAEFPDMPERYSVAVEVDDSKVLAAVEWAKHHHTQGALIWYHHKYVGEWITHLLKVAGIPVLHCPAGKVHNSRILEEGHKGQVCVASVSAHHVGKNLQFRGPTYFAQWTRGAHIAEQALGRNHRTGQKRDRLVYSAAFWWTFDHENFAATVNDSAYIQQTTGAPQKLMIGDYSPLPPVIPCSATLREKGFQVKKLSVEAESLLNNKFR